MRRGTFCFKYKALAAFYDSFAHHRIFGYFLAFLDNCYRRKRPYGVAYRPAVDKRLGALLFRFGYLLYERQLHLKYHGYLEVLEFLCRLNVVSYYLRDLPESYRRAHSVVYFLSLIVALVWGKLLCKFVKPLFHSPHGVVYLFYKPVWIDGRRLHNKKIAELLELRF